MLTTQDAVTAVHTDGPALVLENPGALQAGLLSMLQRNAAMREYDDLLSRVDTDVPDPALRCVLTGSIRAALAICEQQMLQQQRERSLAVVLETAQDLTAIRDLDMVLGAIVRRARQIFGSHIGYLTNFDRLRNDFYIRATDGAISERFKNVRVPIDHGICGHVLKHKTPYHSSDYLLDAGFAHDQGIDLAIRDEGVRSLLGAPLMVGNHCIGMLCICDRHPRRHEPWEVALLSTLAAQAAIAIENARLFQEAQVALQRASEANASLHRQAEEIEAAADAQEQMTKLVARGCTMLDLMEMVGQLLDGHVVLLDEAEQLTQQTQARRLASDAAEDKAGDDGGARGNPLPVLLQSMPVQDAVHQALGAGRRSGRSQEVECDSNGVHIRVAALMGADRLLGALLIASNHLITPTRIRTFERGALVAGVVLLSQERSELVVSNESAAAIRALVSWQQEGLSALQSRTKPFGLSLADPLRMAVISVEGRDIEYALRRMRAGVPRDTLMEEFEGLIVALCADTSAAQLDQALHDTLLADERLTPLGVLSGPLSRVDALPSCFRALKRGIDILRALGRSREVAPEAMLSMYSLLFEQRQVVDVSSFIDATLGRLVSHDQRRNTDLTGTLLAYLEHAQNAKATADALGIHVNTLRQRLETVDDLLKGWRQDGRFLELHVALRLQSLRSGLQRPAGDAH